MRHVLAASVVLLLAGSAHAADEVTIHVTGDAGGVLEQQMYAGTGKRWAPLCTSPCVVKAPRDGWFRIGSPPGKDVTPSNPFGIESKDATDVTFDVDVATSSNRRTGLLVGAIGALIAAAGGVTALVGAAIVISEQPPPCWFLCGLSPPPPPPKSDVGANMAIGIGAVHLALGVMILIAGFGTVASKGRLSRVRQSTPLTAPPHLPDEARLRDVPAPRMMTFPVVSFRF